MARPTKAFNDRREVQRHIRVTLDEDAQLEQAADTLGLTVAEFMRRRALDYRLPPTVQRAQTDAVAAMTLVGIGNNLNQIARHANAGRGLPVRGMLEDTLTHLNAALDALHGPRDQPPRPVL